MNLTESFLTALDSITANKLRSVLTMLGVIIGVAAVIALLAIGNGVSASITDEISSIGTNLITIFPNAENAQGYAPLSIGDVEALADPLNAPDLLEVSASVSGNLPVVYGRESVQAGVNGVTANHFQVNNIDEYQLGDGLTENDIDSSARVAVLGAAVAVDLFGEAEFPVGRSLRINGVSYEVVGVLTESGGGFGDNTDDTVFIPISTAQSRLFTTRTRTGERAVNTITVQAVSEERTDAALEQITDTLRERHDIVFAEDDDFTLFSQTDLLATFDTITATLTTFLGSIAAISLLVGGIGIMNIMLVSVTERTREIGIRKAIGALKRDILVQFLLESTVLSLMGGILGLTLGWGITQLASLAFDFNMVIDPGTVALAVGFAAGVGLLFGIYPAWRAAGLRPIEALRYE
ncbi:MAG: ABC transporter permease [Anaerolineales bacterium]|nr:ABC transporter permease [Anaerolineales bacterium]